MNIYKKNNKPENKHISNEHTHYLVMIIELGHLLNHNCNRYHAKFEINLTVLIYLTHKRTVPNEKSFDLKNALIEVLLYIIVILKSKR